MSSDSPESAQNYVSVLLYRAILSVCTQVMAWETEWREVNRNLEEAIVLCFACFTVARCVLPLVLRCFFSTLVGALASVKL